MQHGLLKYDCSQQHSSGRHWPSRNVSYPRKLIFAVPCSGLDGGEDRRWFEAGAPLDSHCVRFFQVRDSQAHTDTDATAEVCVYCCMLRFWDVDNLFEVAVCYSFVTQ
jgi:hypothetical protein